MSHYRYRILIKDQIYSLPCPDFNFFSLFIA
jgi:hypothetical protein